jgi:hypothetical protein
MTALQGTALHGTCGVRNRRTGGGGRVSALGDVQQARTGEVTA